MLPQCSEFYNLRAFSGLEKNWGVDISVAFDQCSVGAGGSILQLPCLSQEVSDICTVFQRGPRGTGSSYLSGDSHVKSLFIGFLPSLPHFSSPLKIFLGDHLSNKPTCTQIFFVRSALGAIQTKADTS